MAVLLGGTGPVPAATVIEGAVADIEEPAVQTDGLDRRFRSDVCSVAEVGVPATGRAGRIPGCVAEKHDAFRRRRLGSSRGERTHRGGVG